jgi:hypothetical protein
MKTTFRTCLLLAFALLCFGFGFKSNLLVPAHQQFYLGGNQNNAFDVSATNKGLVEVTLLLLPDNGEEKVLQVLKPGESVKTQTPAKTALLIRNLTNFRARLKVVAPGKPESLNMYYKNEDEYKK